MTEIDTGFRADAPQGLSDEEQARRVMAEATRLTNLSPGEWKLWIGKSADRLAVPRADLEDLVKVILKHKERTEREAKAEDRRRQQRVARQRAAAQRQKQRKQERERRRLAKDAERKNKEKQTKIWSRSALSSLTFATPKAAPPQ